MKLNRSFWFRAGVIVPLLVALTGGTTSLLKNFWDESKLLSNNLSEWETISLKPGEGLCHIKKYVYSRFRHPSDCVLADIAIKEALPGKIPPPYLAGEMIKVGPDKKNKIAGIVYYPSQLINHYCYKVIAFRSVSIPFVASDFEAKAVQVKVMECLKGDKKKKSPRQDIKLHFAKFSSSIRSMLLKVAPYDALKIKGSLNDYMNIKRVSKEDRFAVRYLKKSKKVSHFIYFHGPRKAYGNKPFWIVVWKKHNGHWTHRRFSEFESVLETIRFSS